MVVSSPSSQHYSQKTPDHLLEDEDEEIDNSTRERYPVFAKYFESNLKARLQNYVFNPNRSRNSSKQWTNNNAESINILKLSTCWRPKSTQELIEKLYQVTHLCFMDYRSAMHITGNYRLSTNEKHYLADDALWRCKTEEDKRKLFLTFLHDKKKKPKQQHITSKDGTLSVLDKANAISKIPNATKRHVNVRSNKRW